MAAVASQPPVGFVSGFTQDQNFQPLDQCGVPNPFFYHSWANDFNEALVAGNYTSTATGTGASAFASTAGDGGLITGTSGTTAGVVGLQALPASFTINSQPKKVFYEARANLSVVNDAGITLLFGLFQSASAGVPTDGVYLKYVNGVWTLNSIVSSTLTAVTTPTLATPVNATAFDVGIYMTRLGDVLGYVDSQLVGFIPQSNLGTPGNPQNAGAVARLIGPTLTTVALSPGVFMVQTGTNARTLLVDFMGAWKER
jgi:hypothetical protein